MPSDVEALRYATDRSGIVHVVTDLEPAAGVYVTQCRLRLDVRRADVWRSADPPGIVCAQCRAVPTNDSSTAA